MNTNTKIKKVKSYRVIQEKLRNKALLRGVNLMAPETIFLSKDTKFGKNVTIEPYVVIGSNVKKALVTMLTMTNYLYLIISAYSSQPTFKIISVDVIWCGNK